jgi:hypothetical protein
MFTCHWFPFLDTPLYFDPLKRLPLSDADFPSLGVALIMISDSF